MTAGRLLTRMCPRHIFQVGVKENFSVGSWRTNAKSQIKQMYRKDTQKYGYDCDEVKHIGKLEHKLDLILRLVVIIQIVHSERASNDDFAHKETHTSIIAFNH